VDRQTERLTEGLNEKQKKQLQKNIESKILKDNPQNAHALNFIGYSYVEREVKMDEALELLTRASELRPDDGYIKDSLGWYYYKIGNVQKALSVITDASKLAKNDTSIQKHLAIIYAKLNNYKMAKKYLESALKYSSNSQTSLELKEAIKAIETKRFPASFK
jgi:Flp pilus assembly protein TadD